MTYDHIVRRESIQDGVVLYSGYIIRGTNNFISVIGIATFPLKPVMLSCIGPIPLGVKVHLSYSMIEDHINVTSIIYQDSSDIKLGQCPEF